MILSQVDLAHRVAYRFVNSMSRTDPHDHALTWTIPPTFPGIPDEVVVQCSDGCVVTAQDVEAAISETRSITRGSCRFSEVHVNDGSNRVRFQVRGKDGTRLKGTVTVNVIAREDQLIAYSMIELDDEGET